MERPRFRSSLHVEVVEPDTVFLLAEDKHWILSGATYKRLAPLLDGRHSLQDLLTSLSDTISPPDLFYALDQLAKKGYVVEADTSLPAAQAAFWDHVGVHPRHVLPRLNETSVAVRAVGRADAEPLKSALGEIGVSIASEGALLLVATDDYLAPELEALNREALSSGQHWLPMKLLGTQLWLGPFFEPGESSCWNCMAQRIRGNRQVESYILRTREDQAPLPISRGSLPTAGAMMANLAATEVARWLVKGRTDALRNQLITFDVRSGEFQKHVVVRRPQCPVCGDPTLRDATRAPAPITLSSRRKKFTADGGHRHRFPEETYADYKHHVSPITGAVSWLVDMSEPDSHLLYSYAAGHNFALPSANINALRQNLRARSGGKGRTDIQARVSAIGEAIERYSGVFRGEHEITLRASYQALGEPAIHLHDCLLFSEAQHERRDHWNTHSPSPYQFVPRRFDERVEMDWTPLWSLTEERVRYLPTAYCYFGHPDMTRYAFCGSDANGCAAGNTIEEAILQGFLELVERDCVALWWYNRVRRPGVDIASFGLGSYFAELEAHYGALSRNLWVIDITSDLNIPAFAVFSKRTDQPVEDIILGFGAHLDPKIALLRAFTEVNQFLPALPRPGAPGGSAIYEMHDQSAIEWFKAATTANQPYLLPDERLPRRRLEDFAPLASDDLRDDVLTCVRIARQAGLETLVLDQTLPDVGMPVARVVVPGLRHFWRRLGPGRLYDVPVQLGWLAAPLAESELNPFSMFI